MYALSISRRNEISTDTVPPPNCNGWGGGDDTRAAGCVNKNDDTSAAVMILHQSVDAFLRRWMLFGGRNRDHARFILSKKLALKTLRPKQLQRGLGPICILQSALWSWSSQCKCMASGQTLINWKGSTGMEDSCWSQASREDKLPSQGHQTTAARGQVESWFRGMQIPMESKRLSYNMKKWILPLRSS